MPDATALLDRLPLRYDEILVGGKWQPAADGVLEMPDPTTGEVFATVP
jgi:hypothetical protein